jgi:hypothetical protein
MLKTKLFSSSTKLPISEYESFIKNNPHIKIVSVNLTKNDWVLLTYYEN